MALRSSLRHIMGSYNNGSNSNGMIVVVRTVSPSHFENGTWKAGGRCERRRPVEELMEEGNGGLEWEVRKVQVEEVERVKEEGKRLGLGFEALDITWAMLMRLDGHPGQYWRDKKKGYNDCVHWCLPGPDLWNDLLLALLRRLGS
nr:trichome birefringence-like protein 19 [Fagopyrum tataricum]